MESPPPVDETRAPTLLREVHLRDYLRILQQHRWTILAAFLLTVGVTAVWTFLQTPIYRAVAIVEVQPQARRLAAGQDVSGLGSASMSWYAEEKYHHTQVEIIKSRDVAGRVVRLLGLDKDSDFVESKDPVESFRKQIMVDPRRDTGLIEISIKGPDPDKITRRVNAVAEQYVNRNYDKAKENVQQAMAAIRDQMQQLQKDFVGAERQRMDELESSRIYNPENQQAIVAQTLKQYSEEQTKNQIQLNGLLRILAQIRDLQRNGGDLLAVPALAEDQNLREQINKRIDLEAQLESTKVEMKSGHPKYAEMRSQLETVNQRIQDHIARVLGRIENEYALAQSRRDYLAQQIQSVEEQSLVVDRASSQYDVYKATSDTKMRVVEVINKALNEVQLGAQLVTNNVSVLDTATPPLFPIKPKKRLNLMVGALFGLCLGVATAFFVEYLDNTFRTPEDVENVLGLSVLSVIPRVEGAGLGERAVAEAFQSLRTSIIFSSKNRRRKVLLITSTGPQEGKSSTVANLGRTLAATGDRVLIIDCDLRRPRQHEIFGVSRDHGLTNYLAAPLDRKEWSGLVLTLTPPTLHLLPSGPLPPSPPELLGSERFRDLLAAFRESYDWVLIDSPPAASLADACLLAAVADMSVLVIQYNRTDRDLVAKTLQRIRAVSANVAGALLNNVDLSRAYHKDYYYSAYYYAEDESKKSRKRREDRKAGVG